MGEEEVAGQDWQLGLFSDPGQIEQSWVDSPDCIEGLRLLLRALLAHEFPELLPGEFAGLRPVQQQEQYRAEGVKDRVLPFELQPPLLLTALLLALHHQLLDVGPQVEIFEVAGEPDQLAELLRLVPRELVLALEGEEGVEGLGLQFLGGRVLPVVVIHQLLPGVVSLQSVVSNQLQCCLPILQVLPLSLHRHHLPLWQHLLTEPSQVRLVGPTPLEPDEQVLELLFFEGTVELPIDEEFELEAADESGQAGIEQYRLTVSTSSLEVLECLFPSLPGQLCQHPFFQLLPQSLNLSVRPPLFLLGPVDPESALDDPGRLLLIARSWGPHPPAGYHPDEPVPVNQSLLLGRVDQCLLETLTGELQGCDLVQVLYEQGGGVVGAVDGGVAERDVALVAEGEMAEGGGGEEVLDGSGESRSSAGRRQGQEALQLGESGLGLMLEVDCGKLIHCIMGDVFLHSKALGFLLRWPIADISYLRVIMNYSEFIPSQGTKLLATSASSSPDGIPQLADCYLRRYHIRKASFTALHLWLGLWWLRVVSQNIGGRRWKGVANWAQLAGALFFLKHQLTYDFYEATKRGETMVQSLGQSYRREHYADSQYWH